MHYRKLIVDFSKSKEADECKSGRFREGFVEQG